MNIFRLKNMKKGWFIGNFVPSSFKTNALEVAYHYHTKGEQPIKHIHKNATEINFVSRGKLIVQSTLLKRGDVFVIAPQEVADPLFLTNCELVVIKTPSIPGDKFLTK